MNRGHRRAALVAPGPRPGAIARLRHVLIVSDPCGSRTQPARLERPMTSPEVERAVLCAYRQRKWTRGRSNPHLLVFSQALRCFSYPSISLYGHEKARCRFDTGSCGLQGGTDRCHNRKGGAGCVFADCPYSMDKPANGRMPLGSRIELVLAEVIVPVLLNMRTEWAA